MTRPHPAPGGPSTAPGTAEPRWAAWLADRAWPPLDPATLGREVLVCAAHPDDEVLGAGALLHALAAAGVRVRVLTATDGDASHPGSQVVTPAQLAARRVAEATAALAALRVAPVADVRLHLPDGRLAEEVPALTRGVLAAAVGVSAVLAPWSGDGHPDHDTLGAVAEQVAGRAGLPLLAFPVWAWEWADPGDPRLPWDRALTAPAPAGARAAKRAAVACFASQTTALGPAPEDAAVLSPGFLAHFARDAELFFTAPGGGAAR